MPRALRPSIVLPLALQLAAWAPVQAAQQVVFQSRGRGMPRADQRLHGVLERGNYVVFTRDTILDADQVVAGDLILIRSTLRVEGRIEGDLIGVESDIFARPGAVVGGWVVVLAGGFYGSSLADLSSPPIDASLYDYRAERQPDGSFVIRAPPAKMGLSLPGLYGLMQPTYERVDALTLAWAVDFERGTSRALPAARSTLRYRTARGKLDGDLTLRWPLSQHMLELRAGRTVRSNDEWANGDLVNSIYGLMAAVDTRNYYEADFVDGELRLDYGAAVRWRPGLRVSWEDARSLANRDPFSIFTVRGGFQPNLAVSELSIAAVKLDTEVEAWLSEKVVLGFSLGVEYSDQDVAGDTSFTLIDGGLDFEIALARRHSLIVEARGQTPISSSSPPPQRWRALGGWGSLPTLAPVERAGDRFWWLATTYRARLSNRSNLLSRVVAWLQYAAGNAWPKSAERPTTTHNAGAGLTFGPLSAGVYTAPNDDFKTVLFVGIDGRR